jgi:hypothetical protein
MNEQRNILTPDQPTDRARAIVEAGRLIDALADGDAAAVKDAWYAVGKFTRAAINEIRTAEARAAGQLHHTSPNEFLGI